MKKKTGFILLASILTVLVLLTLVYFALFSRFTVVQDDAWKMVLPKSTYRNLRLQLIKSKCRLKVITVTQEEAFDSDYLNSLFEKMDNGGFVLTSPVITAAVMTNKIELSKQFEKTMVFGIGNNNENSYFDTVLISNSVDGWTQAATLINSTDKVALIYSDGTSKDLGYITEAMPSVNFNKYNIDDYGNLAKAEILKAIKDANINVVVCPGISNISNYFDDQTTQKWIVDYRFAAAVKKGCLLGYVCPDIYLSVKSYLSNSIFQTQPKLGVLQYGFKAVK